MRSPHCSLELCYCALSLFLPPPPSSLCSLSLLFHALSLPLSLPLSPLSLPPSLLPSLSLSPSLHSYFSRPLPLLQTLNGSVSLSDGDPLKFIFTSGDGQVYSFKPSSSTARDQWMNDIKAILTTQEQMKKGVYLYASI